MFPKKHCWRRLFAYKPPTLPHGVAVSAERWVGPSPPPEQTHHKSQLTKTKELLGLARTAARSPTKILQEPSTENKHFANPQKFTPQRGSQLIRALPHLRPLAATWSNQPVCPQSPPRLHQRHRLGRPQNRASPTWPQTIKPSRNRAGLFHRQQDTPPRTSLPAKRLNCPNAGASTTGNSRSRLTAPLAAAQPLPNFQSPLLFQLPRHQTRLPRFSQPPSLPQNHSSSPLLLHLLALSALSSPAPRPTIASAARRSHPTTTAGDATSPDQPPRQAHGEAVSAERGVGRSPPPEQTHVGRLADKPRRFDTASTQANKPHRHFTANQRGNQPPSPTRALETL